MLSLVSQMAFQKLKMTYAFVSHCVFLSPVIAWNTTGEGESGQLRGPRDRWILSLKLSLPCFSPLISVDASDFSLWTCCRRVFVWSLRDACFVDLEVGAGYPFNTQRRASQWDGSSGVNKQSQAFMHHSPSNSEVYVCIPQCLKSTET